MTLRKFVDLCRINALILGVALSVSPLFAQPVGWTEVREFEITHESGTELTNYQVLLTLDTATPIAEGHMQPDGDDLRFAPAVDGTGGPLDYWIESGIDTASTKIWVEIPSVPASSTVPLFVFWGNPGASAQSSIVDTFEGPYSGNDQVTGGNPGGSGDRQRGFHFTTSRDLLVVAMGKYEPTGTTRYLTMFDLDNQAAPIAQNQVSGPAATYSYEPLTTPIWLPQNPYWDPANDPEPTFGYIVLLFLATGDQYYISSDTGVGPYLTYVRTRWCNTCDQNTLPTNVTTGHFGYPDFSYFARAEVPDPEPTVTQILSADLGITVTDGSELVGEGLSLSYEIVVSNLGYNDQPSASVSDTFPADLNSCQWTCLAEPGAYCSPGPVAGDIIDTVNLIAGSSLTYTATCTVAAIPGTVITNTASVSGIGVPDPNSANDSNTDTTTVEAVLFADGFESGDMAAWVP